MAEEVKFCERCDNLRTCQLIEDPFLSEVSPEDGPYEKKWWCKKCADDRRDDI